MGGCMGGWMDGWVNMWVNGDNMGTMGMWRPHGDNMETTWDSMRTMWRQHGDNIGTSGM